MRRISVKYDSLSLFMRAGFVYTLQDLCVRAVHTVLARRYIKASAEPCIHTISPAARGASAKREGHWWLQVVTKHGADGLRDLGHLLQDTLALVRTKLCAKGLHEAVWMPPKTECAIGALALGLALPWPET